jgi:hypothetical protein
MCKLFVIDTMDFHIGRPGINTVTMVAIFIWRLANQESFRQIGLRFGLGEATCVRCFDKVLNRLYAKRNLHIKYVTWNHLHSFLVSRLVYSHT